MSDYLIKEAQVVNIDSVDDEATEDQIEEALTNEWRTNSRCMDTI